MRQDYPRKPVRSGRAYDFQRQMRVATIRSRVNAGQSSKVTYTQQGVFVEPIVDESAGGEGGGSNIQRFRIKSVSNDYTVCRTWDGTTEGVTDVLVAKSYFLRVTSFNNLTINGVRYTSTGTQTRNLLHTGLVPATATSQEETVPAYIVDGEIDAFQPEGGTGVIVTAPDPLVWEELTARTWLAPFRVYDVCVNNSPKKVVIRGGTPF